MGIVRKLLQNFLPESKYNFNIFFKTKKLFQVISSLRVPVRLRPTENFYRYFYIICNIISTKVIGLC